MLKLIGSILMIGATTAIGVSKMEAMTARVRALNAFAAAFDMIDAETRFSLTPLPELFYRLAKTLPPPADKFFENCLIRGGDLTETALPSVWSRALKDVNGLLPEDRLLISRAGDLLGRFDPENQYQSLAFVTEGIKSRLSEAEEKRRTEGKTVTTLAVAAGFALVIIFI